MADIAPAKSRWIGRVLRDRWRIDLRLARGGVGTVFAATHKNNGNRVAIKLLHPEFSSDEDTRSRFLQEGYAANQVNHPGVVRILDDDVTEDGVAFLVMELLEGELLERRRHRLGGRLPLLEVYEVADQLLDVLAAAHEKGIVHRDIKPDNLFLTTEGRLKVLDFGFAQMKTGVRKEQTATGFLLGTPGFMSPEQAIGARGQVDAKTDIWAVGATLFTLLSGLPVHDGQSAAEMLVAAANYEARSLATVAPGLPPKLVQVVDRALAFDKRGRWPSARAMKTALLDVPGRSGEPPVSSQNLTDTNGPPSEGRTLFTSPLIVEELDGEDLEDAKPSWPEQHTAFAPNAIDPALLANVRSPISERMPAAPRASAPPPPPPPRRSSHPADEEMATLARPSPFDAPMPPSATPRIPSFVDPAELASGGGHTMVMGAGYGGPPVPPPPSSGTPMRQSYHSNPAFEMRAPPSSEFLAGPARPAPPSRPAGSRVLVLVAVVVFSMVVVVVTGLLVLAAAD